jgi:phosphoribosylaminoimidazole carboxylase (NCAIR synthetase)
VWHKENKNAKRLEEFVQFIDMVTKDSEHFEHSHANLATHSLAGILERYHIYRITKDNLHMNDTYNETHNPIFETLHECYTI